MNTDERKKEIIDKWFKEYVEEERMEEAKIKIIMSNPEYIKWISDFTKDREGFSDEDLYFFKGSEKENIEKLGLFYKGIDTYAKANHIYPKLNEYGSYYKVKYNNAGFQIGIVEGQGITVYFCNKSSLKNNEDSIDFNDILSNKKQDNVDLINFTLKTLSSDIKKAYKIGVPLEAIEETFNNTIGHLKNKRKTKKLIK